MVGCSPSNPLPRDGNPQESSDDPQTDHSTKTSHGPDGQSPEVTRRQRGPDGRIPTKLAEWALEALREDTIEGVGIPTLSGQHSVS